MVLGSVVVEVDGVEVDDASLHASFSIVEGEEALNVDELSEDGDELEVLEDEDGDELSVLEDEDGDELEVLDVLDGLELSVELESLEEDEPMLDTISPTTESAA